MRRGRNFPLSVIYLLIAISIFFPAQAFAFFQNPDYSGIDTYVQSQLKAWNIPGAALIIVRNGTVAHLQVYGQAGSGRQVLSTTPFVLGSCTKSFTALAVMQLVEAGKIILDNPVHYYLPWFQVADASASEKITVRHLLNNTSGMPIESTHVLMANPTDLTLEDRVRSMKNQDLSSDPGVRYQYANFNYLTLAQIIEVVSGQSYGQYLDQYIFTPLEMKNSFTDPKLAQQNGLSSGHTWWFGIPIKNPVIERQDMLGAGSLMISAEDMSHYLIAQINQGTYQNNTLISPEGIAAMRTPPQLQEEDTIYGMGWTRFEQDGLQIINHNGGSHSFTCSMILIPDLQIGIAVLANVTNLFGPFPARSLAFNVKNILLTGEIPNVPADYRNFYLPMNGGFLIATLVVLWSFANLWRQPKMINKPRSRWHTIQPFLVDGLLALALLFGPVLGLGWDLWRGMFVHQPDIVYWCLLAGVLMAAKVVLLIFRERRKI